MAFRAEQEGATARKIWDNLASFRHLAEAVRSLVKEDCAPEAPLAHRRKLTLILTAALDGALRAKALVDSFAAQSSLVPSVDPCTTSPLVELPEHVAELEQELEQEVDLLTRQYKRFGDPHFVPWTEDYEVSRRRRFAEKDRQLLMARRDRICSESAECIANLPPSGPAQSATLPSGHTNFSWPPLGRLWSSTQTRSRFNLSGPSHGGPNSAREGWVPKSHTPFSWGVEVQFKVQFEYQFEAGPLLLLEVMEHSRQVESSHLFRSGLLRAQVPF